MTQALQNRFGPGSNHEQARRIKAMPQDSGVRQRVRERARGLAASVDRRRPLRRSELESLGERLVAEAGLPEEFLGFAMVAIDNEFWADQFAAVRYDKRVLLLPHCLRLDDRCRGTYSPRGLTCAACGSCCIAGLEAEARALGYEVLIAEGTPAVVQVLLGGECDAILGVACLDSLEKAFRHVSELGLPHLAVPLLRDGCSETEAELDTIREVMRLSRGGALPSTRGYAPLLRAAARLFDEGALRELLGPHVGHAAAPGPGDALGSTEEIAVDWLRKGGKRFRPFLTLAAYAVAAHGEVAVRPDSGAAERLPLSVRRVALAVEALHKASLTHDDIEDGDLFRYGADTLHRSYGVPAAINVGDYLIGLGYRLVAGEAGSLGAETVADILGCLSLAHLKLSRGQGAELAWQADPSRELRAVDVLQAYALKTAPAFEAALYIGMRLAHEATLVGRLRSYCRSLGVAYQARNDLKDWDTDADKVVLGQDALAGRPTILRAFAMEKLHGEARAELLRPSSAGRSSSAALDRVRDVFATTGAFDKTEQLIRKCQARALEEAEKMDTEPLRDLLRFVVDAML